MAQGSAPCTDGFAALRGAPIGSGPRDPRPWAKPRTAGSWSSDSFDRFDGLDRLVRRPSDRGACRGSADLLLENAPDAIRFANGLWDDFGRVTPLIATWRASPGWHLYVARKFVTLNWPPKNGRHEVCYFDRGEHT